MMNETLDGKSKILDRNKSLIDVPNRKVLRIFWYDSKLLCNRKQNPFFFVEMQFSFENQL